MLAGFEGFCVALITRLGFGWKALTLAGPSSSLFNNNNIAATSFQCQCI